MRVGRKEESYCYWKLIFFFQGVLLEVHDSQGGFMQQTELLSSLSLEMNWPPCCEGDPSLSLVYLLFACLLCPPFKSASLLK